jgi:hypothetical protein
LPPFIDKEATGLREFCSSAAAIEKLDVHIAFQLLHEVRE